VLLRLRRKTLCDTAIATYWLGIVLALFVTTGPLTEWQTWGVGFWFTMELTLLSGWGLGYLSLFILALASAAVLIGRQRASTTASALRTYWPGCTLTFIMALGCVFAVKGWSFFPADPGQSGMTAGASGAIVALLLALCIAAVWPVPRNSPAAE
jgi:hypothetical protein